MGLLAASNISEATIHSEKIILGSGCFWGAEKGYELLPGVIDAVSGYADGKGVRASYREITKLKNKFNVNNHAEVVEVTYNKNLISTEELLMHYFESHDPTQLNRQGNDIGTQYRSVIYSSDTSDLDIANESKEIYQKELEKNNYSTITTEIDIVKNYFLAEEYHQQYLAKNPNGYCGIGGTGCTFPNE